MRLKRLEKAWRSFAIRVVGAVMGPPYPAARPRWDARPFRVLLLRPDRIGDMILSTGLIRTIASSHATITLDVLASAANAAVLSEEKQVREVIVLERGRPWTYPTLALRLRRARYDVVIDCMATAPSLTTLLLMLASGARDRIGVAGRGNDFAITLPVAPLPEATHFVDHLAALATAFGVDPATTDWSPRVCMTPAELAAAEKVWGVRDGGPRLLVNLSAGKARCRWPDERFVAALRHLRAAHPALRILVIGSPGDAASVARVAAAAGAEPARTPSIRDALALVATTDFVFTPDTSIAHAASAFRKPAVVMFAGGPVGRWTLYGVPGHNLASPQRQLASLPVEPVRKALEDLLEKGAESDE